MDFRPFCYDIDVARHDESARIDITNSTGAARNLLFEAVVGEGGKRHARSFALAGGEKRSVKIPMSGTDMEVRVKVRERPGGKVVYLGGTKLQEVSFAIPPEAVTDTVSPTSHYTVFTKHWLERGNHRTLPRPDQRKKPLALFAAPGEYEPASFAVRASKDLGAVQVELAGDLLGENGTVIPTSCVEIRIAELMTRWLDAGTFERVECYLIRNRPLDIPTNTTRRFWLTVLVPPNAVPGQYATKVRIVPANAPAQSLLLRLEVLPVVLSRPEGMNYFMYFNPSFFPPELQSPEHVRRFYLDMRQHGMTTATVYAWPGAKDWISIDRDRNGPMPMATQLDLLRDTGLVADWAAVPWIGAESYRADVWKVVAESARERSWPELLWYLIDEPTDERLPRVEACMKRVANFRARYPELPLRTTTAGASNPKCSHYYDVWIAGCYIDEKTIARGREMGKTIWTYDCGLAPVDAITDRHYFGFWTWAAGLQGASHWAYYDGGARNR
ncbi:MAG: hypothetical protein KAI66_05770, partial [Lentisphaeria bacterium]|nr:hypothetical protein [Lentisphaeria bacterium]